MPSAPTGRERRGHQATARASAPQAPKGLAFAAPLDHRVRGSSFPPSPFQPKSPSVPAETSTLMPGSWRGSWGNPAASPATAPLQEPCLSCIPKKRDVAGHVPGCCRPAHEPASSCLIPLPGRAHNQSLKSFTSTSEERFSLSMASPVSSPKSHMTGQGRIRSSSHNEEPIPADGLRCWKSFASSKVNQSQQRPSEQPAAYLRAA